MKPVMHDVPSEFTSERLLIRSPRPGDGAPVRAAVLESLAELRPWMAWAQEIDEVEDFEARAREAQAKFLAREDLMLYLFDRTDGTFVGGSGLHRMDWNIPSFSIGYWVRTSLVGRGYVTEAVRAIEAVAFDLGAKRVSIEMDVRNERSAAVPRRLGYDLEGILRNSATDVHGAPVDMMVWSKTER